MDLTTTTILQLRFAAEVLTVRGEFAVVLTDEKIGDEPFRFAGNRIVASRSALCSIRVLSESDLNDQDLPGNIQYSRRVFPEGTE